MFRLALLFCALSLAAGGIAVAQITTKKKTTVEEKTPVTPAVVPPLIRQVPTFETTTSDSSGTKTTVQSPSGVDSAITFSARDSIVFFVNKKTMHLRGDANLLQKQQDLKAESIDLDFNRATMSAQGTIDSATGSAKGFPHFTDNGQEFVGEKILFNFKTKQGTVSMAEMKQQEGFYFAEKIKRLDETTLFAQNAAFTACPAPHPHFYFSSPKMKIIANNSIFLDPLIVYVEDLPIFLLPIGVYFPNEKGRRSGLLLSFPTFDNRSGVVFRGLGYYWAASDYFDSKLTADVFSKAGIVFNSLSQYVKRDEFNGTLDARLGWMRPDIQSEYLQNYAVTWNHDQTIIPQTTSIGGTMNFTSDDFNRSTFGNVNQRVQQQIYSNFSFNHRTDYGASVTATYSRTQNILDSKLYTNTPTIRFALPNFFPLKGIAPTGSWLADISLQNSSEMKYEWRQSLNPSDSTYQRATTKYIRHSPSISISPKLGYFTFTPIINFGLSQYFRRIASRQVVYEAGRRTIVESVEDSAYLPPFSEFSFSTGITVGTRLYGVIDGIDFFGMTAFRHTIQPFVTYSHTPAWGDSFWGSYSDTNGQVIRYNRFALDGGGASAYISSNSLSMSLMNSFEGKVKQGDTLPDLNIEYLRIQANTSWNPDVVKNGVRGAGRTWSDLRMSFRSPAFTLFDLSMDAGFSPYRNDTTIRRFSLAEGLVRLTDLNFNVPLSFSSGGADNLAGLFGGEEETTDSAANDLGARFAARRSHRQETADIFGENTPGVQPINIPWNLSLSANFRYNASNPSRITRDFSIRANGSIKLTPTLSIDGGASYDVITQELAVPTINISKTFDCYRLNVQWVPTGFYRGFYLAFEALSSQLRDLKFEKRDPAFFR